MRAPPLRSRRIAPSALLVVGAVVLSVPALAWARGDGGAAHLAEAGLEGATASCHIRDRSVFSVRAARNGHSAAERAKHASEVLERAVEDSSSEVRVEQNGDVAVVYVGSTPLIQLGADDAAADGDASVAVHAAAIAARATDAIHAERKRSALARTIFSTSLLVFSALVAFLALGRLGAVVGRLRAWVESRPATIPTVRIAGIDVVRPTALRGVALGAIDASRWVFRVGLVYAWLLFSLSLFDATHAYSERLTGYVLAPLSGFLGRIAASMPVLFIGAVAALALLVTLRVIALFFEGVGRGEPSLSWLPADLAAPTSLLLRAGVVIAALAVATPLITGAEDGPLARASIVAIAAIGLALTPVLASAAVGVTVLFGRSMKVGDFVEVGGKPGVVRGLHLLGVTLEDRQGCTVKVPHLVSLLHPTSIKGPIPPVVVPVHVAPSADVERVASLLSAAAERVGIPGRVELASIDADGALYLVTLLSASATARSELLAAVAHDLREAGVALGRSAGPP